MSSKKTYRIGERNTNKQGLVMEVTKYYSNKNIVVTFIDTGEDVKCRYSQFKNGTVKATVFPYKKSHVVLTALSLIASIVALLSLIIIGSKKIFF